MASDDRQVTQLLDMHLVKSGHIAIEHGRSLNKVEDLRLIADYKGDPVTLETAAWALEQSEKLFAAVEALIEQH